MTGESFETIMDRNNTTLPEAQIVDGNNGMSASSKRGTKLTGLLVTVFALSVCLCLLSTVSGASTHIPKKLNKREIASPASPITPNAQKLCSQNTPCGWAIYVPFTRRIDYFMKNTCDCKSTLSCLKTDDDLSINAYVYRCKPKPAGETTDLMPTGE